MQNEGVRTKKQLELPSHLASKPVATRVTSWDHFSLFRVLVTLLLLNPAVLLLVHAVSHLVTLTSITLILLVLASTFSIGSPVWVSAIIALEDFTFLNYYFIPPVHTFRIDRTDDLITLLVFLLASVSVSLLLKALGTKQEQVINLLEKFDQIGRKGERASALPRYELGDWQIDFTSRIVIKADGNPSKIHFTPIEWRLLEVLVRAEGALVTHTSILKKVWGEQYSTERNYLRLYLSQLRKKLEPNPKRPVLLTTEQGTGYRAHSRRLEIQ